jgi:hypothetical protein
MSSSSSSSSSYDLDGFPILRLDEITSLDTIILKDSEPAAKELLDSLIGQSNSNKLVTYLQRQLESTKKTRPQNLGYIAKVNKEKTEILNIYIDRKTAAVQNGYASTSALDTPVKNNTLSNGFYYVLFDSCEDNLKEKWIEEHDECILYKDGIGQYDSENNLIKEFTCKYDCMTQLKISQKSMAKVLDKDVMYDKCFYKSLGSKMYI